MGVKRELPDIMRLDEVQGLVRRAVEEDVGAGDATTVALVPPGLLVRAVVIARSECIVAGQAVARGVFAEVDRGVRCEAVIPDGQPAFAGAVVTRLAGPAASILTAERTALNFMQRLTGIATLTNRFVRKVSRYGTLILDTRKTTPLLRVLEKYAVLCGGGENHRMGLYDRIMIKDNHRRLWGDGSAGGLDRAIEVVRRAFPDLDVEVEVENEEELRSALSALPEWILLDNMNLEQTRQCVAICGGRVKLEASGGITLANVEDVAMTGVDAISIGALTHSAPAADLSLEIE